MKSNINQSQDFIQKEAKEHNTCLHRERQNVGEWIESNDADESFERMLNSML